MAANVQKYHSSIRIIHWLMAILILGMIGLGWYMSELPKGYPTKSALVAVHKSFGSLLLILFFVRVGMRFATTIPDLPKSFPAFEKLAAHLGHGMLYIFMGIVPLSGYAMSNLNGYKVNLFGLALPNLFPKNKELARVAHDAHEILPYILLALIAFHVLAVVKHRFFDKKEHDVLGRML